ncbi:hypothetical protein E2C01_004336 [Portunus trituberculatus]|uniref:Zinc finger PHD-type domain-containing protein n=1 Tax=Portunus trituberculatus TaxID=210409 RepID=A0A5B7CR48_PORTR|nr:hypothetical protein [Portunus trituberculatus]
MTKQIKRNQDKAESSWVHHRGSDSEDGVSTKCLYCSDTFGNSVKEGWVCCANCKSWAHEQCADTDDDDFEEELRSKMDSGGPSYPIVLFLARQKVEVVRSAKLRSVTVDD